MAVYNIYESNLCFYYKKIIDFERHYRNEIEDEASRTAINMNLILCITCFLEGILEDRGHMLLGYYNSITNCVDLEEFENRKAFNTINNKINNFFRIKISQTTGISNFDNIFEIFLGKSFINSKNVSPFIEGVNALFQLRNVIAHGRKVHAYELEAYYANGIEEHFSGGYKKAEDYLTKNGLLHKKYIKAKNADIFFTDTISDHFDNIVTNFIKELDKFIKSNLIIGDSLKRKLQKYNEANKTNISIYQFFRLQGTLP